MLILDGGTGRELARQGAPFRVPEWSALALIEGPEFVQRVHRSYLAAGAEVISTNSYALVPFHLGAERFADSGQHLADLAGRLARASVAEFQADVASGPAAAGADQVAGVDQVAGAGLAGSPPWVAGSLPPVGGSYRPDLFDAGQARTVLATLVAGLRPHVDLWLAETLSRVDEARLVREVLGDDRRPLWLSFTLRDQDAASGAAAQLRSGEPVALAAQVALALGARGLLFNCSQPEVMGAAVDAACQALRLQGADLPVGVYANAFPPQAADAEANAVLDPIRQDLDPDGYLAFARDWQARGALMIGGCCGIGPEHIAALRAARDALRVAKR